MPVITVESEDTAFTTSDELYAAFPFASNVNAVSGVVPAFVVAPVVEDERTVAASVAVTAPL